MTLHLRLRNILLAVGISASLCFLTACTTSKVQSTAKMSSRVWEPQNPEFRSFYGWDDKSGSWKLERLRNADGSIVAIHIFRPPLFKKRKGTVFLHHGYLEHTALRVPLALEFVKRGWIMVGVDLPGHGLSSGTRADIESFSYYLAAFEAAMEAYKWPRPWRAVGHSTGGATILMAMQQPGIEFDFVVLEAPLIRTYLWTPSIWLKNQLGDRITTVNRWPEGSHNDDPFYKLLKDDPLYISEVPLHWIDSVEIYFQSTFAWVPVRGRILILQGDKDTVVDKDYNIPFLRQLLPDAEILEIENGGHHLLMDGSQAGDDAHRELFSRW
ncbi:MAG: alpha/beta hydrolase [Spirochaetales bacterium]|nr:alpha/beta hydrolase [Spirochaetales bacterium]